MSNEDFLNKLWKWQGFEPSFCRGMYLWLNKLSNYFLQTFCWVIWICCFNLPNRWEMSSYALLSVYNEWSSVFRYCHWQKYNKNVWWLLASYLRVMDEAVWIKIRSMALARSGHLIQNRETTLKISFSWRNRMIKSKSF